MGGSNPYIDEVKYKPATQKFKVTFLPSGKTIEVDPAKIPYGHNGLPGSILDFSEGIKAGLDPARMIEVLNAGTGANSATRDKWPRAVLPRTFDFGFSAQLSLKDTRLALDEARAMGVPLPTGERLAALLERTLATYGDDADFTAMARIVEADAGLDPDR